MLKQHTIFGEFSEKARNVSNFSSEDITKPQFLPSIIKEKVFLLT